LETARTNLENGIKEVAQDASVPDEQRQAVLKQLVDTHSLLDELGDAERYQPLWEEEQKMREADASGEPLPRVRIETTKGTLEVELFENQAPNTVANFISLCEKKFYDGLPFHRVITHFMAQGGCPVGDGSGGPGYTIRAELDGTHRNFFRGTLGLALAGSADSGGSQFFICYVPRSYLNGKYVAFGRVIEGMDVLSDLAHVDPESKDKEQHSEELPDQIISTTVVRKRDHAYVPETLPPPK
jgi:cyclophilin family peptidyl-prolyl cis-trans isomerase